jgi:TetR/AcrR family transcriptional repressor of nem operon
VWHSAIQEKELRLPVERYFKHLEARLVEILSGEATAGPVQLDIA